MTDTQLADDLIEQLDRLGPPLRGRFVPLAATADLEVQSASAYLDRAHLEAQMFRTIPVSDHAAVDRRVVASRFIRELCLGIMPPVLVGMAMGIGIDASLARAHSVWERWNLRGSTAVAPHALSVAADAFTICAECRPTLRGVATFLPTHEELRALVWRKLLAEHLVPLFEAVLAIVKLSPRVLWASAAEGAGRVATFAALRLSADAARPFIEECDALFVAERLPGIGEPNPLSGQLHWKDIGRSDFPRGLMLRSVCCMCFTLPDRRGQTYCGTCPLPPIETLISLNSTYERTVVAAGPPDTRKHR